MKKIFVIILTATLLTSSCLTACAKDKPKEEAVKKLRRDMTKAELASKIKDRLDGTEEILDFIPGLRKEEDVSGEFFYAYNGVRIQEMDRDTLDKLLSRIQSEATRINTERINKQLESIQQAQRATMAAQQVAHIQSVIQPPPQPPKTPYTPPQAQNQIPRIPEPSPQPPKR